MVADAIRSGLGVQTIGGSRPDRSYSCRRYGHAVPDETLSIRDNRTGTEVEIPISDGTIRATDLGQLGLMSYDPAFLNTASTRSGITYIDGDAGILRYRGYPIEQLAEHASFLETAWLLFEGELPTRDELAAWEDEVRLHTFVWT